MDTPFRAKTGLDRGSAPDQPRSRHRARASRNFARTARSPPNGCPARRGDKRPRPHPGAPGSARTVSPSQGREPTPRSGVDPGTWPPSQAARGSSPGQMGSHTRKALRSEESVLPKTVLKHPVSARAGGYVGGSNDTILTESLDALEPVPKLARPERADRAVARWARGLFPPFRRCLKAGLGRRLGDLRGVGLGGVGDPLKSRMNPTRLPRFRPVGDTTTLSQLSSIQTGGSAFLSMSRRTIVAPNYHWSSEPRGIGK
jgi:hypothetical protein